jgi:hypothetical protein
MNTKSIVTVSATFLNPNWQSQSWVAVQEIGLSIGERQGSSGSSFCNPNEIQ